jgi:hypothetical protein
MSLTKIVVPIMDSRSVDVRDFDNVPEFLGEILQEVLVPSTPACFLGAWYRKVFSSTDSWLGLEGLITLGEFTPDETRYNLDGFGRSMDNPSIYMGGKSSKESDAGLGLNVSYLSADTSLDLTMSSPKVAYRPFWRYIYNEALDVDFNVRRREVNSWNVSNPRSLCYYYFPGDTIRMKIYSPIPHYLQLRIEVVQKTSIPKYVAIRRSYGLVDDSPSDFYSPLFHSQGHGVLPAEFKRVNSIDQFGNEGYHAKMTQATVSEALWHETYLYRKIEGNIVKVPMNKDRQVSMICPSEQAIQVVTLDESKGSEAITIHPGKSQLQ